MPLDVHHDVRVGWYERLQLPNLLRQAFHCGNAEPVLVARDQLRDNRHLLVVARDQAPTARDIIEALVAARTKTPINDGDKNTGSQLPPKISRIAVVCLGEVDIIVKPPARPYNGRLMSTWIRFGRVDRMTGSYIHQSISIVTNCVWFHSS